MREQRGEGATPSWAAYVANFRDSDLPLARRLARAARNVARRLYPPPPRVCCGHDGEPGC